MADGSRLTTVDAVRERGSWLCTVRDRYGEPTEVLLVPCEGDDGDAVEAWVNRCMHEPQALDVGRGATVRDGEVVCPRHGSGFDTCTGACDNGEAAGTRLLGVDTAVEGGVVYLTDAAYSFAHDGGIEDGDDGPSSTSHIGF